MEKCSESDSKSFCNCISCNTLLCATHKNIHADDHQDHKFTKLKFGVDEPLRQTLLKSLKVKIHLLEISSGQVSKTAKLVVDQINELIKEILNKIQEQKSHINAIITQLLDTDCIEAEGKEIDEELENDLSYAYEICYLPKVDPSQNDGEISRENSQKFAKVLDEVKLMAGSGLIKNMFEKSLACFESNSKDLIIGKRSFWIERF